MVKPKNFMEVINGNHCRWLGGKIGRTEYCGGALVPGQSYCAKHQAIVYKPKKQKDESDGQK